MGTLIVYRSVLGSTRKYAEWLADELECPACTFIDVTDGQLERAGRVIVMSGTYAGWMPLTGFLQSRWRTLSGKRIIVVSVGISPDGDAYTTVTLNRIPAEIRNRVKLFRLPGAALGMAPLGDVRKDNLKELVKYLRNRREAEGK
jgi:menaquinone-dependent protoporphyrinogen IX oxidase